MLRLTTKNFGPIADAEIDLKPLSVFVGPNKTGKYYLATLVYALHRSWTGPFWRGPARTFRSPAFRRLSSLFIQRFEEVYSKSSDDDRKALDDKEGFPPNRVRGRSAQRFQVASLPAILGKGVALAATSATDAYVKDLESELLRCFGSEVSELSSGGVQGSPFHPLLVHSGMSPSEYRILRRVRVAHRGKYYPIETVRCGSRPRFLVT